MMGRAYQGDKVFKIETEDIAFRKIVEKVDQTLADVRYEIEAICDDEVACRLRNDPPIPLTADDVYLHPGAKGWETDETGRVLFEGKLSRDEVESAVVTYNVGKADQMDPLQPEPRIDIARPSHGEGAEEYDSSIIIEQSEPPATVPLEIGEEILDESTETSDQLGDQTEEISLEGDDMSIDNEAAQSANQQVEDNKSIITRLFDELEGAQLSSEEQQHFRELLGVENVGHDPESLRVKIDHIDRVVSDLSAYREALAEFIDANGSGQQIIEDMQNRFESIEGQLAVFEDQFNEIADSMSTVANHLDEIDEQVEKHSHELITVETQREEDKTVLTEALEANREQIQDQLAILRDEIEKLDEEITRSREWRESLGEALRGET